MFFLEKKNWNKSWLPAFWKKKKKKNTEGQKEHFFLRQNKTGCKFLRKSSFSKLRTKQKQAIHLSFASWISELSVCFCIVRSFEKGDFLQNSYPVLFCLIKSVLFNLFVFLFFFICGINQTSPIQLKFQLVFEMWDQYSKLYNRLLSVLEKKTDSVTRRWG